MGLAHSYYHGYDDDAPPAYTPEKTSDFHDYATDSKISGPEKLHTGAVHFPIPTVHNPVDSTGETPLQALFKYDIVIVLDDSRSMMTLDRGCTKRRWDQVSNRPLTLARALPWSRVTDIFTRILGMERSIRAGARGTQIQQRWDRDPLPEQTEE